MLIKEILVEHTDEDHFMTVSDIINTLESDYGISTSRKTIYEDIDMLLEAGFDIECVKGSKISGQAIATNGELKSLRTSSVLIAHIAAGSKVKNGKNMTVPFTITCTKVGTATLTATDAKGNTATAKVTTVSSGTTGGTQPTPTPTGEIKFAQTSITCLPGRKVFTRVLQYDIIYT